MTALFNAPSCIIGLIFGAIIGGLIVEKGPGMNYFRVQEALVNQVIADCEATLPRNQSCELTAKVKN